MRFGLFLALLIPLAVIAAVTVPVPALNGFPRQDGGQSIESFHTPVCLRLSYDSVHSHPEMPRWMRLTDSSAHAFSARGWPAYRANDAMSFQYGAWRLAGGDSLDIRWFHDGEIVRLPIRGDTLTGRAGWLQAPSLLDALVSRGFSVRAIRVPCGAALGDPACPSGWYQAHTADMSMALCLPSSLVQRHQDSGEATIWERGEPISPKHVWLIIDVYADTTNDDPWPPHLASRASCLADCATADSVVQHVDTLAGSVVQVETGLVSGGEPGFRRQPALTAGWTTSWGSRVRVFGIAVHGATLDTLRFALRTLKVIVP